MEQKEMQNSSSSGVREAREADDDDDRRQAAGSANGWSETPHPKLGLGRYGRGGDRRILRGCLLPSLLHAANCMQQRCDPGEARAVNFRARDPVLPV